MSAKYAFDKQLELRNLADGAETSSADEAGKALDVLGAGDFKVVFEVTALDTGSANETYSLVVDVDSVAAFSDAPVEVADLTVTAPGTYEIPLSGDYVKSLDPNAAAIRVGAVLGGTTPSITYGAYVAPTR